MSDKEAGTPAGSPEDDDVTRVFVGYRELLFSIVYNMLGSVADTEDVLQETWLSWQRRNRQLSAEEIENPRAYLVRVAANHALARRATINRRRETYVGQWLPEPLVTDTLEDRRESANVADHALSAESVSMALLVVLETLSPLERAVFVLHEVFGYTQVEIAEILERSPSSIRQLAHRARGHVHARRPRYQADLQLQRRVTERFIAAALGGDLSALMAMLAPDVTLWTDGGGKTPTAGLRPVASREKVARLLTGYALRRPGDIEVRYLHVNADSAAVVFTGGYPFAVFVLDVEPDSDLVRGIYAVTNPDKLIGVPGNDTPQDAGLSPYCAGS